MNYAFGSKASKNYFHNSAGDERFAVLVNKKMWLLDFCIR